MATLFALLCLVPLLQSCTGQNIPEGFVVLVESSPQALDPRFVYDDIGTKISKLMFAGLVTFDTPDSNYELVLAESIEQPTPTRYDVTLKPGLTFHDGSPLTAEDVVFSYESTPHQMKHIERIEVHDERRISFHLKEPFAPFMTSLSMGLVSKDELTGGSELPFDFPRPFATEKPAATIGAGAYRLTERRGDHLVVLERFENFAGGTPRIPRLVFRVVQDDNARLISLLGGSSDLAMNNVTPLMLPVVQDDDSLQIQTAESIKYTYLMFNTRIEPLNDVRVRKAIAYAIDREEIVEYKFRGLATMSTGMLAPNHWAYNGDVQRYPRNLDKAKALLDEAGYPDPPGDEPRFEISFRTSSSKFRKAIAELLAAQLGDVGIEVKVETMEFGTFFSLIHEGNFELATLQWPSPIEPDLLYVVYHSQMVPWENEDGRGRNRGGYANQELDKLLEEGRRNPNRERRKEVYARAQEILADELPYVPLWHEHNIAVLSSGVEDFEVLPNARLRGLERAR